MCKNSGKKLMVMKIKFGWNDLQLVIEPKKAAQAMEMMEFINNAQIVEERYVGLKGDEYVLEEKTSETSVTIGTVNRRIVSSEEFKELEERSQREYKERKEEAARQEEEAKRLAEAAALEQAQADEETMVNESVAETKI